MFVYNLEHYNTWQSTLGSKRIGMRIASFVEVSNFIRCGQRL